LSIADEVFPAGVLDMERLNDLLGKADIEYKDAQDRQADFHAFRRTYCTLLHRWGLPEAAIMQLMRVSDRRLIDKNYLEAGIVLVPCEPWRVPWLLRRSQGRSLATDSAGHGMASPGTGDGVDNRIKPSINPGDCHGTAWMVAAGLGQDQNWGTRIRS
jgi:hypothetical protein